MGAKEIQTKQQFLLNATEVHRGRVHTDEEAIY